MNEAGTFENLGCSIFGSFVLNRAYILGILFARGKFVLSPKLAAGEQPTAATIQLRYEVQLDARFAWILT